jgi:hypothetical protein
MRGVTVAALVVSAVIGVGSSAYAQLQLPPVILSASTDATTVTIRGSNFGSSGTPRVTLNSTDLVVQTASATQVVAFLPANLSGGNYLLVVYRAPNNVLFGVFVVTIGTQGPKGDKGDKGDPCLSTDPACVGPKGDAGAPGAPGTSVTVTPLAVGNANCPNGGTMFTAANGVSYACNGAGAAARTCPAGYVAVGTALCVENIDGSGFTFTGGAARCRAQGAHLPSSGEMRAAMTSGVTLGNGGVIDDWIDDQDSSSTALFINSNTDPDAVASRSVTTSAFARCFIRIE